MSLPEIEAEIARLPIGEISELLAWLADYHGRLWDRQTESDPSAARFNGLLTEMKREIAAGLARPL